MITLEGLSKRYGDTPAVDALDLTVAPGRVTGFLGPNGAGKSTTMRMILGLDTPSAGAALVDGRPYAEWPVPLAKAGALLDAKALHPRRSARNHLVAMARSNGIGVSRVDEVLAIVGIDSVGRRRAGGFSLGMGQRLGIAGALLGDPEVLLFDEPVNGLDPDGVRWVRRLMRSLAAEGRTVFVSSHLMSEMQLTADQLVVIGRGRLIADAPIADVIAMSSRSTVHVRVPETAGLTALKDRLATEADRVDTQLDRLIVTGVPVERIGDLAHELGVRLHELRTNHASLEEAYMELTADSVQYGVAEAVA
ncbi:ABC-2 type transport system ATP-binding protein [Kribbella amoyensis]|uniref:ABC-2 type transport system ATP-binding protein n=1 Tax=Kribbella amoyensis TaxID=996641 RepID=A0A561BZL0_9ACTN|nr:ATP-binding cassette domain-containing protein [Kribbella amoyensis]TWD84310.1 ABC-2 type transport system ATP-binding protein [Kribbella amoyensis]